jgi:hypothetical protein
MQSDLFSLFQAFFSTRDGFRVIFFYKELRPLLAVERLALKLKPGYFGGKKITLSDRSRTITLNLRMLIERDTIQQKKKSFSEKSWSD